MPLIKDLKEDVPVRRSLRLSSNSSTHSKIITRRTSTTEPSSAPPKATSKRRFSSADDANPMIKSETKEKSETKINIKKISPTEGLKINSIKEDVTEELETITSETNRKSSQDIAAKDETFTKRITRSQSNSVTKFVEENNTILTTQKEKSSDTDVKQIENIDCQVRCSSEKMSDNINTLAPIEEDDEEQNSMKESISNTADCDMSDLSKKTVSSEEQVMSESQECGKENDEKDEALEVSLKHKNADDDGSHKISAVDSTLPSIDKSDTKNETFDKSINSLKSSDAISGVNDDENIIEAVPKSQNEDISMSSEKQDINENKLASNENNSVQSEHILSADHINIDDLKNKLHKAIHSTDEESEKLTKMMDKSVNKSNQCKGIYSETISTSCNTSQLPETSLLQHEETENCKKQFELLNISTEIKCTNENSEKTSIVVETSVLVVEDDDAENMSLNERDSFNQLNKTCEPEEKIIKENKTETDNGQSMNIHKGELIKQVLDNDTHLKASESECTETEKQNKFIAESTMETDEHEHQSVDGDIERTRNQQNKSKTETTGLILANTNSSKIDETKSCKTESDNNNKEIIENINMEETHNSLDIDAKIDKLLATVDPTFSSEDEFEQNEFIDDMAEEGEEDTPSEGSNDIIEVGEEINTESDFSTDDSYDSDSFIDDEEQVQLLSGEEYDLSLEQPKKKSRIIRLSSGSDDEIVKIQKKEPVQPKKRKKSRIITLVDSSDEEDVTNIPEVTAQIEEKKIESLILEEDTEDDKLEIDISDNESRDEKFSKTETQNEVKIDVQQKGEERINEIEENKLEVVVSDNETPDQEFNEIVSETKAEINQKNEMNDFSSTVEIENNLCSNENVDEVINKNLDESFKENLTSLAEGEDSAKKTNSKKIIILENIRVQDIHNKDLSNRINDVIDSLRSKINNSNEVSINLSLDYSDRDFDVDQTLPSSDQSEDANKSRIFEDDINEQHKTVESLAVDISDDTPKNIDENEVQKVKKTKKRKRNRKRKNSLAKNIELLYKYNSDSKTSKDDPKKKKKKRKHSTVDSFDKKTIEEVSVPPKNVETSNFVGMKSKKHKFTVSYKNISEDNLISIKNQKSEEKMKQQNIKDDIPFKKGKKRKRSKSQMSVDNNNPLNHEVNEIIIPKKKKRKSLKTQEIDADIAKMNILEAALLDNKKKKLYTSNQPLSDGWNVKKVTIKPSRVNVSQVKGAESEVLKCSRNENPIAKNFHAKDFKNLMIYDVKRVKRISTKQILNKKM